MGEGVSVKVPGRSGPMGRETKARVSRGWRKEGGEGEGRGRMRGWGMGCSSLCGRVVVGRLEKESDCSEGAKACYLSRCR